MDKIIASVYQKSGLRFVGRASGHKVTIDLSKDRGGTGKGASPLEFFLWSLGSCSGLSIASILGKMGIVLDGFRVDVYGELSPKDSFPVVFTRFKVVYRMEGTRLSSEPIVKAVTLAEEKYCPLMTLFPRIAPVNYELYINGVLIREAVLDRRPEGASSPAAQEVPSGAEGEPEMVRPAGDDGFPPVETAPAAPCGD